MDFIYEMPKEMLGEAEHKGKLELLDYDSKTYDDSDKTLKKHAWVYLPYGYDAGKKYNVLYLLHGGGCNHNYWFKDFPTTVTILDNMMEKKICGPFGDHEAEVERICTTLSQGKDNGYDLKYMFCGNGDKDIAFAEHKDIMEKAVEKSEYLLPGKNYDFYIIPGGVHDINAWQLHLYHALQVFFS